MAAIRGKGGRCAGQPAAAATRECPDLRRVERAYRRESTFLALVLGSNKTSFRRLCVRFPSWVTSLCEDYTHRVASGRSPMAGYDAGSSSTNSPLRRCFFVVVRSPSGPRDPLTPTRYARSEGLVTSARARRTDNTPC